jgi:hypothetical protein
VKKPLNYRVIAAEKGTTDALLSHLQVLDDVPRVLLSLVGQPLNREVGLEHVVIKILDPAEASRSHESGQVAPRKGLPQAV